MLTIMVILHMLIVVLLMLPLARDLSDLADALRRALHVHFSELVVEMVKRPDGSMWTLQIKAFRTAAAPAFVTRSTWPRWSSGSSFSFGVVLARFAGLFWEGNRGASAAATASCCASSAASRRSRRTSRRSRCSGCARARLDPRRPRFS